jgi:hypothetical protein
MTIDKPALIIYSFVFQGPHGKDGSNYLSKLWKASTRPIEQGGLGMTAPVSGISDSMDFPILGQHAYSNFCALAAASMPEPDRDEASYVAFMFAYNDVLGLIAVLAPDDPETNWRNLYFHWRRVTLNENPPEGVLSENYVFYGFHGVGEKPSEMGKAVVRALPGDRKETWAKSLASYAMGSGTYVWEGPALDGRRALSVLASAAEGAARAAAQWLFWNGEQNIATFAAYLLNSSKLNYEYNTYTRDISSLRDQEKQVDALVNTVLRMHEQIEVGRHINSEEIIGCQSRVARIQSDASGLLINLFHLRELQQTVHIAEYNLRAFIPPKPRLANDAQAFLKRDLERAQWLQKQIDCDIAYMETVCGRAMESYKVTDLRLEQVRQANARRQHHLELTQTVLLGALLICLDAMHAFHTEVPFRHDLQWPVIALLMALAFAVPPLLLHWRDGYGKLEYVGATFVGASAAWIATEVWRESLEATRHPSLLRWITFVGLIVLANVGLWGADRLQTRARRRA